MFVSQQCCADPCTVSFCYLRPSSFVDDLLGRCSSSDSSAVARRRDRGRALGSRSESLSASWRVDAEPRRAPAADARRPTPAADDGLRRAALGSASDSLSRSSRDLAARDRDPDLQRIRGRITNDAVVRTEQAATVDCTVSHRSCLGANDAENVDRKQISVSQSMNP